MKYFISLGLDLLVSFTAFLKPQLESVMPKPPAELYRDFQNKIDELQTHLPKNPNVIIDNVQKMMDQLQANLSKTPNIPIDVLENVIDNAKNLQEQFDVFEKRIAKVMATLEKISKHDDLVVNNLVVHQD
jgi:superfamily I DNA/RNA helicase